VAKDEKEAQDKQDLKDARHQKSLQEQRLNSLRNQSTHSKSTQSNSTDIHQHLNLFPELDSKNPEYIQEQQELEKKHDKTVYLGAPKEQQWFEKKEIVQYSSQKSNVSFMKQSTVETRKVKDELLKSKQDPLSLFKSKTSSISHASTLYKTSSAPKTSTLDKTSSASNKSNTSGKKTIEELRQERLDREKAERLRTQALLNPTSSLANRHEKESRFYNSQFNPDAVRGSSKKEDERKPWHSRYQPY
jgi:hypothetical protein